MRDKQTCLPRTVSSRSLLISSDVSDVQPSSFCDNVVPSGQCSRSEVRSPCKIVVGFDVGPQKKCLMDACLSPRSILDTSTALCTHDRQQAVVRSNRSGLGCLLAAKSCGEENVRLATSTEIANGDSLRQRERDQEMRLARCTDFHSQLPEKMSTWPLEVCSFGPPDSDFCACSEKVLRIGMQNSEVENKQSAADIGPQIESSMILTGDHNVILPDALPKALKRVTEISVNENEDVSSAQKFAVKKHARSPVYEEVRSSLSTSSTRVCNDETVLVPVRTSRMHISYFRKCDSPRRHGVTSEELVYKHTHLNAEEGRACPSIFSASSPPPRALSPPRASAGFLEVCNGCGRSLHPWKDIFMYRGDQSFCSAECRYQRILLDERNQRTGK
ncbi:hypothetical protein KP509_03G102400 [Ceratopteris richardii]|uniref:FLZ-type domain-containing protein n=1 Tax=Ceratopteris richardii TaxID=49495 RepID=A0A8T2V6B6_CERRI|nr:hypothetical protein KP509_03G102400 [Ceratopteris richardii]